MFSLEGKTALVTGASGGIGGAIAMSLSEAGAKVALSGTRVEALEQAAATLPGVSVIVPCNLSDPAEADALISQTLDKAGGLDILVANAGLTRDKLLMQMKDE
ncbi:MAG: SDR family NAD(P)-dependent oxidoreductase, partial [Pseudomonadota bacterium]